MRYESSYERERERERMAGEIVRRVIKGGREVDERRLEKRDC